MTIEAKLNIGTKVYKAYQILRDKNWHCGKHELPGTQSAGLVRDLRGHGANIETKAMPCRVCQEVTTHRRLI